MTELHNGKSRMNDNIFKYFLILTIFMFSSTCLIAQNNHNVLQNESIRWRRFSDAPNSLYHFLTGEALELLKLRSAEISGIKSKEDIMHRQAVVRQTILNILGEFPQKTDLNAKITGTVVKKDYRVENLIYESFPGFYVTASLFIPHNVKKPAPAILFCSGHTDIVYRSKYYQLPLLNLVKKGFIILAFDPIDQGERLQYFNPESGRSSIGGPTNCHSYGSAQVFLTGQSIARYFIWDGIRGIDYLVSRKEVDPNRIGVHGLSGGGLQTAYISAMDERVMASAPAGYITSYTRLLESIGAQDGEQNLYHGILNKIDQADYVELRAPKPTLIMATTNDFFSIQGSRETYSEVKRIFEILGKPDNIEMTEDDFDHNYTKKNREAMYAFFQKHLQLPGSSSEEEVEFLTPEELRKTSTGQVSTSLGGETVFSLNRKETERLIKARRVILPSDLPEAVNSAKMLSGFVEPSVTDEPVFTGRIVHDGYVTEKYFVKGGGDYIIPYLLMIPVRSDNNKALIYLHPSGKASEASTGGEIELFVRNGFTVMAPDMIGTGEIGDEGVKGDAYVYLDSYSLWFTSVLTGRSIVGIQAGDMVRLTKILQKHFAIKDIYAVAREEMSPVLLHAAAFDSSISRIALIRPYSSYSTVAMNRFYNPKFINSMVPGALTAYDLPDLAASLAPRNLLILGVTDGNGSENMLKASITILTLLKQHIGIKDQKNNYVLNPLARVKNIGILLKNG